MKTLILSMILLLAASVLNAETLPEAKVRLAVEGRNISQLTIAELDDLSPTSGGYIGNLFSTELVFKVGTSTFILNAISLTLLILFTFCSVLLFFTPIGLALFRGGLHYVAGVILCAVGASAIGNSFKGLHRYLKRYGGAVKGFAMYMHNYFIPRYKNNITALAFLGTAFLIFSIGLRGVKFMVAHEPTLIVFAIIVEMFVLVMLALTTWYERTLDITSEETGGLALDKEEVLKDINALATKVKKA